jgi:hypothetical protein
MLRRSVNTQIEERLEEGSVSEERVLDYKGCVVGIIAYFCYNSLPL